MQIAEAQRDVREIYRGGATGTTVSGAVWLIAAAVAQWVDIETAVIVLFVGGMLIFPLSAALLRILAGPATLPRGHPMNALGAQLAVVVPLGVLLAALVSTARPEWFFPFAAAIVGAHYFPFVFLYGMGEYAVLAAVLVTLAAVLILWPAGVATAAWATGLVELLASPVLLWGARRRSGSSPTDTPTQA
ncbi:MAG: hypothetical protein WBG57_08245 [Ornithinimicrobium sp.]